MRDAIAEWIIINLIKYDMHHFTQCAKWCIITTSKRDRVRGKKMMNLTDVKAKELKVGDVMLFAGMQHTIVKIEEPILSPSDLFITLSIAGTGVWAKRDRVTLVN